MAAYVVYNLTELIDEKTMGEYVQKFNAMFGKYDGKVIAIAPDFEVLEGSWNAVRVVIIEFADLRAVKRWHEADEYQPLIKLRQSAARGDMIALNGLS